MSGQSIYFLRKLIMFAIISDTRKINIHDSAYTWSSRRTTQIHSCPFVGHMHPSRGTCGVSALHHAKAYPTFKISIRQERDHASILILLTLRHNEAIKTPRDRLLHGIASATDHRCQPRRDLGMSQLWSAHLKSEMLWRQRAAECRGSNGSHARYNVGSVMVTGAT